MHTETRPQEPLQMCMLQRRPSSAGTALHARVCFAKEANERTHSLGAKTAAKDMDGGGGIWKPPIEKSALELRK